MGAPAERLAYTMAEAAQALGISRAFAYRLVELGELHTVKIGKCRRVSRDELERLIGEGAS